MSNAPQQSTIAKAKVGPGNAVVNYDEALAAEALEISKRIASPGGDVIRIKNKNFVLPSGDSTPTLDVVIAAFITVNKFFEKPFDRTNIVPPDCMAAGQEITLMRPFANVPKAQDNGGGCHSCWANQWGSSLGPNKKGKACGNHRYLALLDPNHQNDGPLMLLLCSPTAGRFFDAHVVASTAMTTSPTSVGSLIKVVTQISLATEVDYPTQRFKILRPNADKDNPDCDWRSAFERRAAAVERLLVPPDFAPAMVTGKPDAGKK
jgi:hypothetical protein